MNKLLQVSLLALVLLMLAGCTDDDHRLAELANDSSQRQAAQNQEMARLNREVAEGSKRLVETVAQTSRDTTALQRELQTERRDLAAEHRHESLLAAVLWNGGSVLVCLLPLVVCVYLFHTLAGESTEDRIVDVLIEEATIQRPFWLQDPRDEPTLDHEGTPERLTGEADQPPDPRHLTQSPF